MEGTKVARPLKRLPKNNSFNEQMKNCDPDSLMPPASNVHFALQASLAAETANDECQSPLFLKRNRGMSEGNEDLTINVLNANTEGMIRHTVDKLQRQTSEKK